MDTNDEDNVLLNLRRYPLYDFDYERVRTLAYRLSRDAPDPLLNWLQAEREETRQQSYEALGFNERSREFLLSYDLIDSIRFLSNSPRKKEWRGDKRNRRCAVCGRSRSEAPFKTEAHLLPACTGNRFLFTADECDDCNLASGCTTEEELGKMLAPHRAIGRVQTRNKASTKLRLGDTESSIGGQERDQALRVELIEGSVTVDVKDIGSNTIEISAKGPSFRPISALRSLGRSAWHLLPHDIRSSYSDLLMWVRAEPSPEPARFLQGFIPGPGLRHTTFCVWARRADATSPGPRLLYLLALANYVVVVPSPEYMISTDQIPVPPLPRGYGLPTVHGCRVANDDKFTIIHSFRVNYLSKTLVAAQSPLRVRATVSRGDARTSIECELIIDTSAPKLYLYSLSGGDLRGQLTVLVDPLRLSESGSIAGGASRVGYELGEYDRGGDIALTKNFIQLLSTGSTLDIVLTESGKTVTSVLLPPVPEFDADALEEALAESDRAAKLTDDAG
jgi:hypothetical protein